MSALKNALVKKISTAVVFGKINAALIAKSEYLIKEDSAVHVMAVMGIASDLKTGDHPTYGPWAALTGTFKAINPHTGKVFNSGSCFLPDIALDLLAGAVKHGQTVEFAFNVYAVLDEDSPVGFRYTVVPLVKEEHDPLAALEAKLHTPLLAAPQQHGGKKK